MKRAFQCVRMKYLNEMTSNQNIMGLKLKRKDYVDIYEIFRCHAVLKKFV